MKNPLKSSIEKMNQSFQNSEKDKRAAALVIANKELAFQNEEKEKRAAELIITWTASAMEKDREAILAHGFDAYIAKPIIAKEFFKVINEVLYGK